MPRSAPSRRSRAPQQRRGPGPASAPPRETPWLAPALTWAAFALSLVLVLARGMMGESIRSATLLPAGSAGEPRGPGPSTSLLLDLLFCVPALLVLARRAVDRTWSLARSWSMVPMGLLAAWAALSVAWADDKFSAAVSAANWGSALVFLWSTAQLVRSWLQLRLVAATCYGLLLVLVLSGLYYRFIDWPELKEFWKQESARRLREGGPASDARSLEQFSKNIASGTPLGFSVSTNTYGALLVLTMTVAAGVALQRRKEGDGAAWIVPVALTLLPVAYLLACTRSKAAVGSAALAAAGLAALVWLGDLPRRRARPGYFAGVAVFFLGAAAVVGHGLYRHSLPTSSLAFRWHYWVGSAGVFARHPLIGVGWENFGPHYLAHRLPVAPEEIRDPHNFIVRCFVELGAVGGLLLAAWMLRLWWELTGPAGTGTGIGGEATEEGGRGFPVVPATKSSAAPLAYSALQTPDDSDPGRPRTAAGLVALGVTAAAFNILVSFDWAAPGAFLALETIRRVFFLVGLLAGLLLVALRPGGGRELDDRPAPWLLGAIRLALGVFLLHNLIEFSLFEPNTTCLFALLVGAALGIRGVRAARGVQGTLKADSAANADEPAPSRGTTAARAALAVGGLAWLAVALWLALPVATAEAAAADGDAHLQAANADRQADPPRPGAAEAAKAGNDFEAALRQVPYNADYAFRAAEAWDGAGMPDRARPLLDAAVAADPSSAAYRVGRAEHTLALAAHGAQGTSGTQTTQPAVTLPEAARRQVEDDFSAALALDPANVALRLKFADALERFGEKEQAARQYETAIRYNDQLSREENKRLPDERVEEIRGKVQALRGKGGNAE